MKKVLIITYYWPPGSGPGVQRFLKICKYLREFNWEPLILTVKNGSYPSIDESLLNDIPEKVKVFRTKTIEPFSIFNKITREKGKSLPVGYMPGKVKQGMIERLSFYIRANFFIPDARKGWNRFAYKEAKCIIKKEKINAIITTGPPHSTHLVGLKLKKQYKLPWIIDFRDPWSTIYYNSLLPRTKRAIEKDLNLEKKVLLNADLLTVVSHGMKEEFVDKVKDIEIIYNGFDDEDIPSEFIETKSKFSLCYIGNFKANQNIPVIWQTISELKIELNDFKDNFRLNLTGNIDSSVKNEIQKYHIEDMVEMNPFIPHKEATKQMASSNLLLFIVPKVFGNLKIITGKLFEYIAVRSPILAIGPLNGDAAKILKDVNRDNMHYYDDLERIKNALMNHYNNWRNGNRKLIKHSELNLNKFSRKGLTNILANQLDRLTNENN
ncbi:glycosyltransferase [Bacteroidota bacterium]